MKRIIRKIIKKLFGIDGISLFIKKKKKKLMQKVYTKKYTADDLVSEMCKMGMKNGSVVFVHSSMTEFYNYTGTGKELIEKIIDIIGEEGTLMMPAYPKNKSKLMKLYEIDKEQIAFDVNNTPSGAGYLTEVFRTFPGVKRSVHLQHSVCAYGKLADYFTNEHHLSITAWDEKSPYFKMSQMDTLVFAFGLPYFLGTIIHCTESLLRKKYKYFSIFFDTKYSYKYKDENGNINIHESLTHNFERRRSKRKIITKYFDKNEYHVAKISNLRVEMVNAKYTLELFLELAEKGITMFTSPSPKKYVKNGKFIELDEK